MRTRKDVWKLDPNDETLSWYAAAITEMQKRPISDPTSWYYQAAIHDYPPPGPAVAASLLPSSAEQDVYWCQCQHYSWFFLPWHRAYLLYFEQIVGKIVADLGGPADWALPYWNYSDTSNGGQAQHFPERFRSQLFQGKPNPLWVAGRNPLWVTSGISMVSLYPKDTDITACLGTPGFAMGPGGTPPGFGGGKAGLKHEASTESINIRGACENIPHALMHKAIGGWMNVNVTAPLDPIFWLHHANIDRLWEVWVRRRPAIRNPGDYTNPSDPSWLSAQFNFHDAMRKPLAITVQQVLDTTQPLLNYQYEDVSDPLAPVPVVLPTASWRSLMMAKRIPEMIGATNPEENLLLDSKLTMTQIDLQLPSGPSAKHVPEDLRHYYLTLENVTARKAPVTNYEVYVDLPKGSSPKDHPELFAGMVAGFDLVEASQPRAEHGGGGLTSSFDITSIVSVLRAQGSWNSTRVHVTLIAEGPTEDHQRMPVKIGRVSVHTA